jgi:hypothetical protein
MLNLENLSRKKRFKNLSVVEILYLEEQFPWCTARKEAMFCLKNHVEKKPKCQYHNCNEFASFGKQGSRGYSLGCCRDHNYRLTNLIKYGCENVKQNKEIADKAKNTFNSKSNEKKKEIQLRKEQTMLKKYGVVNPSYSQEIKNKISVKNKVNATSRMLCLKENNQKKYGVDNVFQLETVKEKSKVTFAKKYGVDNPSQLLSVKIQKEKTCFKNYGVRNPSHDIAIFEKQQKYRWKDYTLPSGKLVKIQGYENLALDILLQTYDENDLILERKNIPKIHYGENNKHQYVTDIFIPKENKFIEVKSEYTFTKYLKINLLKEQASKNAGFDFEFLILKRTGEPVSRYEVMSNYYLHNS